jgi:hypothetical protein
MKIHYNYRASLPFYLKQDGVLSKVTTMYNVQNHSRYNVFCRMTSSGMLHRVTLVRTDVSEEGIASIIRVTRIGELRTLAVTRNRSTLRRYTMYSMYSIYSKHASVPSYC